MAQGAVGSGRSREHRVRHLLRDAGFRDGAALPSKEDDGEDQTPEPTRRGQHDGGRTRVLPGERDHHVEPVLGPDQSAASDDTHAAHR